jgi:myosin heavy subunit
VLTQLAYTGMLATLRIQKAGYPIRKRHQAYLDEMRCLDPDAATEGVAALVNSINLNRLPAIRDALTEDMKEPPLAPLSPHR